MFDFFENRRSASIGLDDKIFEGDQKNAPEFLKVYSNWKTNTDKSKEITWWAKDFSIISIFEANVEGLSGAHLKIRTKDGLTTTIKIILMSDLYVLFDGDTRFGGKYACVNNPSCNGIPWVAKIVTTAMDGYHFGGSPTSEDQFLYCPDTIKECLILKRWMEKYD